MTTKEVADKLVSLCSKMQIEEAMNTLYASDIVSVEAGAPPGTDREAKGFEAVAAKAKWWQSTHETHAFHVEGPLVAGDFFSVVFKLDVTFKPENRRFTMEEVAIYKVKDGKIVREEFFYGM